jgi:hypothetical protein
MKKILHILIALLVATPVAVFADSLSFSPPSSIYGSAVDPVTSGSVSLGSGGYVCFTSTGTHVGYNGSAFASGSFPGHFSDYGNIPDVFNGGVGTISCMEGDATVFDWSSGCAGNSATYASCLASATHAAAPDQSIVTYDLTSTPPPDTSIDHAIAVATTSFAQTYGFNMDQAASWMWDNLGQPILGSGIGTLVVMKWYWLGFIAFGIVILFCFYYFRFFRNK